MANNQYVNRVDYGNDTLIDISDTTAEEEDVLVGQTFYTRSGAPATGTLGDATTSTHGLMSAADKTKLDGIATGANKPLYLVYGSSTWNEAKTAYVNGAQLYCLASYSIETPGTGDLRRVAPLVYLGGARGTDSSTINEFEFQYYRSQSTKTTTELCDQIIVYKLHQQDGWSCTMRYVAPKEITGSNGITTTYNNDTLTISAPSMIGATSSTAGNAGFVPAPSIGDQNNFLTGGGTWNAVQSPIVILQYDVSTWADFLTAYQQNAVIFCRISIRNGYSGDNDSINNQRRFAIMAYINDKDNPTKVEFQFYRSVSSANNTTQGDQIFIYTLNASTGWSITTHEVLPTVVQGSTASTAGTTGMVPAPSAGDQDKFLKGDGTWAQSGLPMVILKYGISTWNDFINAYNNNVIVYCRASSNSDPSTGNQTRMAFMAYVNDGTTPTEVEFQYYRSVSSHTSTQYCDQVFIYKLNKTNGWSVTTRYAGLKEIVAGTGISVNYSNNKATVSSTIPDPPTSDGTYTLQAIVSDGTLTYSWIQSNT